MFATGGVEMAMFAHCPSTLPPLTVHAGLALLPSPDRSETQPASLPVCLSVCLSLPFHQEEEGGISLALKGPRCRANRQAEKIDSGFLSEKCTKTDSELKQKPRNPLTRTTLLRPAMECVQIKMYRST